MCTRFLFDINSTFPQQNGTPCFICVIMFEIRQTFSVLLALIIQLSSGPLSVLIVQQNCSDNEFKGSPIISSILDPEVDRQLII